MNPLDDLPDHGTWDEPFLPSAHLCFTCGGRDFFPVPIGDPVCLTCHPMSFPEVNR